MYYRLKVWSQLKTNAGIQQGHIKLIKKYFTVLQKI